MISTVNTDLHLHKQRSKYTLRLNGVVFTVGADGE